VAYIGVLTELASQVTPSGAERQDGRTGEIMEERFFFDRIYAKTARTTVGGEYDLTFLTSAHKTKTPLAFCEFAMAGAERALDVAASKFVPIFRRYDRVHRALFCTSF